jgi:hypothetical protein
MSSTSNGNNAMATATAQQSDNIPNAVPFEANLPFAVKGDSNQESER